ncbi:TPA: PTS sugar transporter subunit IIC, partial [Clostridioides difficile]|nr:PTS sugar transporter subunit IIC [Clostridioides difficile]
MRRYICGVILGDVTAGVLCGVAVQAIFIGQITPGGAVPS